MFLHRTGGIDMATRTYRSKLRLATWLAFAAAVAAGIVGGRIVRLGEPGENFWLVLPVLLAVVGLALAAQLPWWRKLDDMQKSAHLVSWYWGSMGGGAAVLMALLASEGVRSDLAEGGGFVLMGQAVAFLLFLAVWQLRHRGPEA
jgi:hypothetical protein